MKRNLRELSVCEIKHGKLFEFMKQNKNYENRQSGWNIGKFSAELKQSETWVNYFGLQNESWTNYFMTCK